MQTITRPQAPVITADTLEDARTAVDNLAQDAVLQEQVEQWADYLRTRRGGQGSVKVIITARDRYGVSLGLVTITA